MFGIQGYALLILICVISASQLPFLLFSEKLGPVMGKEEWRKNAGRTLLIYFCGFAPGFICGANCCSIWFWQLTMQYYILAGRDSEWCRHGNCHLHSSMSTFQWPSPSLLSSLLPSGAFNSIRILFWIWRWFLTEKLCSWQSITSNPPHITNLSPPDLSSLPPLPISTHLDWYSISKPLDKDINLTEDLETREMMITSNS